MMRKSKHKKVLFGVFAVLLLIGLVYLAMLVATDPADNLVVKDVRFVAGGEERRITGAVFNMTDNRVYTDVAVEAVLFDSEGNELDVVTDEKELLEPGERWQFVARAPADAVAYETRVHSPDNTRAKWLIATVLNAVKGE